MYYDVIVTVSIHAPTWGATTLTRQSRLLGEVSIHAPTWGATWQYLTLVDDFEFQSTHPHGVRRLYKRLRSLVLRFQSTHPHGVRLSIVPISALSSRFQSTHPHGVRLRNVIVPLPFVSFNPRTHMGCDRIFSKRLNITLQKYIICEEKQKE